MTSESPAESSHTWSFFTVELESCHLTSFKHEIIPLNIEIKSKQVKVNLIKPKPA